MKKRQQLKLSMYIVVLEILREYQPDLATVPALEPLIAELERHIDAIQQTVRLQSMCLEGGVQEKTAVRFELETKAFAIAQALLAYGLRQDDPVLKDTFAYPVSYLRRARYLDLVLLVQRILEQSRLIGARLEPYGVTQERLLALETVFLRYNGLLTWPRTGIIERTAICNTLEQQFRSADRLLYEGIDLLIAGLPRAEVQMMYRHARRLVGAPRPKKHGSSAGAMSVQALVSSPLAMPSR